MCGIELVNVMTLAKPLDEAIDLLLMDPVVFLPALPRVMWVLNAMDKRSRERSSVKQTN
jgi:hypothetical protein